jgi:hypothetical protein
MTEETTKSAAPSDRERIALLERVVFQLSEHAALLEGAVSVFTYLLTANALRCAGEDDDPSQWLREYMNTTASGCRQIAPKVTDPTTRVHVQHGIEMAANGFLQNLLQLSGDLEGAPNKLRANT